MLYRMHRWLLPTPEYVGEIVKRRLGLGVRLVWIAGSRYVEVKRLGLWWRVAAGDRQEGGR